MDADFVNETRPRRDCLVFFMSETRPRRDLTQNFGRDRGETETRPRVLVSFFTRLRREPTFNEKKIQYITTHPVQDETKMRLREIEETEMTQR